MPPKITPKNLSYDTTLPPFLQKLQTNYDRGVEGRDGRHESALLRARPKRAKDEGEEGEDEPVYVDEEGNVVDDGARVLLGVEGKEEGKSERNDGGDLGVEGAGDLGEEGVEEGKAVREKENVAGIGGTKKRKIGKVIGSSNTVDDDPNERGKEKNASKPETKSTSTSETKPGTKPKKKVPDKNKKVKLSFGDDE